jgi:hypothetical protein
MYKYYNMHVCKVNLIKKAEKCRIVFYLDSQRIQKHGSTANGNYLTEIPHSQPFEK